MKVIELLESEWENSPIPDKNVIRTLQQQENALRHRREILRQRLGDLQQSDWNDFTKWGDSTIIRRKLRAYQDRITEIDLQLNVILKKYVGAKINMKYAQHDPALALHHAAKVRKGQYPEGEDAIASQGRIAFLYATEVIHHRFEKGEAAMSRDCDYESKNKYHQLFGVKL